MPVGGVDSTGLALTVGSVTPVGAESDEGEVVSATGIAGGSTVGCWTADPVGASADFLPNNPNNAIEVSLLNIYKPIIHC